MIIATGLGGGRRRRRTGSSASKGPPPLNSRIRPGSTSCPFSSVMARSGPSTAHSLKIVSTSSLFLLYHLPEFVRLSCPPCGPGDDAYARTHQVRREGAGTRRQRRLGGFQQSEQDQAAAVVHAGWSDKPLLKSYQKTKPPLGWPRETDSLCPTCVREARQEILDGKKDVSILLNEKVGEIKATILERDGKILMVKDCPLHGHFEDVMAMDTAFFKHLEDVFPGRDIRAHNDEKLHNHGSSTIKHGRGSVLTVDLTNRCNMMCDPCFMDANQVGFVHELSWDDIKMVLDNAISIKPRRQMSVQFSGGEPTISPYFLDAVRYARKVGYNSVQAATNGIEFAKDPEFAKAAAEAGLRYAYLQFDGIGNAANSHRRVGNLFDVKLRAIENLHSAGVDIVPVVTIVNGVNNEQVGRIIEFALDNPKTINFLSFQPRQLHRPRRRSDRRAPPRAALHLVAPGARREEPDGHRRADPRLVPHLVHGQLHRLGRRHAWRREGIRSAHLRLPPELRRRHGRS